MSVNSIRRWKLFRKISAISSIIQGLTWLTMAVICIVMYYAKLPESYDKLKKNVLSEDTRYIDLISFCFYDTLLYKHNDYEDRLLKPKNFHVFAWFYAVLSLCLLGFALAECTALFRRKTSRYDTHIVMVLGSLTLLVCILDIIVTSFAFRDYFRINVFTYDVFDWDSTTIPTTITTTIIPLADYPDFGLIDVNEELPTGPEDVFEANIDLIFKYRIGRKISYGVLIAICARGFTIWIFNCVSGMILLFISFEMFQAPPILKYDNRSIPRAKVDLRAQNDGHSLFGSTFADDYNSLSTPPAQKKRYSLPPDGDRYGREPPRSNPLALSSKNLRNKNMFS